MGWTFRRRIKLGPVNLNLSRSGIGVSAGAGPFRTGVDAKGRRYTNIRGPFGLYNRQYHKAADPALKAAADPNVAAVKDAVIVLLFSIVVLLIGFNGAVAPANQGWLTLFGVLTLAPALIGIVGHLSGPMAVPLKTLYLPRSRKH